MSRRPVPAGRTALATKLAVGKRRVSNQPGLASSASVSAVPIAALTLGGAALLGAGALALAPLWLPLLFVVWLWRRSRRARPPTAGGSGGATIDA